MSTIIRTPDKDTNFADFISDEGINMPDYELLDFEDNSDRTYRKYNVTERKQFSEKPSLDLLKKGTMVLVPLSRLKRTFINSSTQNSVIKNKPFSAYFSDDIKTLINDTGYKQKYSDKLLSNVITKEVNEVTVWIWCRSLGKDYLDGVLINVSPFIENCAVNNAFNGGNFALSFSSLSTRYNQDLGWDLNTTAARFNEQFILTKTLLLNKNSNKRNQFWFTNLLSPQDVVFIQFERLDLENRRNVKDFVVPFSALKGQHFDMIGLIDNPAERYDFTSNENGITVSGRALGDKLLIEDANYFYPLEFISKSSLFVNAGDIQNARALRRMTGEINDLNAYVDRTIRESIEFILESLSNIRVTNDNPFQYGIEDKSGVWKIIEIAIDPEVENRRIVDSSLASAQGSLMSMIRKLCLEPFVEFFSDTYNNKFYFIIRKPPTNLKSYKSLLQTSKDIGLEIKPEDEISVDLNFDDTQTYSWYRLTPQGTFLGNGSQYSLAFLPAIFFPEYADIFGAKPMDVVTNYIEYKPLEEDVNDANKKLRYFEEQSFEDLKFMIESNARNPFTRKGRLTVKGDRRYKKGMAIRLLSTGEVFRIDSVSHTAVFADGSNDRTTVLNVIDGLVEDHFEDYFKIIDFGEQNKTNQNNPIVRSKISIPINVTFDLGKDYVIIPDDQDVVYLQSDIELRNSLRSLSNQSIENVAKIIVRDKKAKLNVVVKVLPSENLASSKTLANSRATKLKSRIITTGNKFGLDISSRVFVSVDKKIDQSLSSKDFFKYVEATVETESPNSTIYKSFNSLNWSVDIEKFNFFLKRKQFLSKNESSSSLNFKGNNEKR